MGGGRGHGGRERDEMMLRGAGARGGFEERGALAWCKACLARGGEADVHEACAGRLEEELACGDEAGEGG